MLFVLTFVVNAVARAIVGGKVKDEPHSGARDPRWTYPSRSRCSGRSASGGGSPTTSRQPFSWLRSCVALVPLIWVLWIVVERGWYAVTRPDWWTHSLRGVLPEQFSGGVYHALYGTVVQAAVAAAMAVPLGFMTAVFLVEYRSGRLVRFTTFMVDVLAGCRRSWRRCSSSACGSPPWDSSRVRFAVSLALVLLMLPVVVRSAEEMLRLVPHDLREASYALGIPKWKTIMRIVVPIAMPGIVTGVLLSIARVMGETAPVLVLVGYSRSINFDIFNGNMASLPLLIYSELNNPEHAGFLRVWGAALTLIIVVAVINIVAALTRFVATRRR